MIMQLMHDLIFLAKNLLRSIMAKSNRNEGGENMEQARLPVAEIKYGDNLLTIEYFKTYPEEAERGNPYNTTFLIRIISGAFSGYADCEYDIKEFSKFINQLEEVYFFKRSEATLSDICYGSEVLFCSDRLGHLEISGTIFGEAAIQSLTFSFVADQTCLGDFIRTLKTYIE